MIERIKAFAAENPRAVIAIDGMSAAGKSTFAACLASEFGGEIVHMDDFFLPAELRTAERLAEPGGNVHYERFATEVASALCRGEAFEYGVFDCSQMSIVDRRSISGRGLVIVEGAYCLRPEFRGLYDLKVFMKIDAATQMERIEKRSGSEKAKMFAEKWIPMETAYFDVLGVEACADIII